MQDLARQGLAPLRGAGNQYSSIQEYSKKQRPAQHLHHLFIVPKGQHWIHRRSPS
ncbi:unnamed protein product [Penicillium nalgiovense]|nr:unnamed protein product [Penicillium nalgiovense]